MKTKIYLALIHHPIKNKRGDKVTTSVTNLDIHDIARSCRTFGVVHYYIVTPVVPQAQLVQKILDHWESDQGSEYNPDRSDALTTISLKESFEQALVEVEQLEGRRPLVVATGANFTEVDGGVDAALRQAKLDNRAILLLFGTGWGIHSELLECVDFMVEPIRGAAEDGYNHLSVRSAVAIYCQQFAGQSLK